MNTTNIVKKLLSQGFTSLFKYLCVYILKKIFLMCL